MRLAAIWHDNILIQAATGRRCVRNAPYELTSAYSTASWYAL